MRAAGWEGQTAASFDAHRGQLVGGLDKASTTAGRIASTLTMVAGSVRTAQGRLDGEWAKIVAIPHTGTLFWPEDEADEKLIEGAIRAAEAIRTDLDAKLKGDVSALEEAQAGWEAMSSTWSAIASGGTDPFDVPTEADTTGIITNGDQTIVNGGAGDDDIRVFIDPQTGEQVVVVNGTPYRVPHGQRIVIRGGGGNDTISVPGDLPLDVTVSGSGGDDTISGGDGNETILGLDGRDSVESGGGDDRVSGGGDRDYVDGGEGDDTIDGGEGDDTLCGLDGNDTISGGEGDDYQEGGEGDDTVIGGDGDDMQSGGEGNDTIHGGSGDDVSYAGRGDDTTYGGSGTDTSRGESGDTTDAENPVTLEIPDTTSWIDIEGSPEFVDRVRADLDMLAGSPRGQQLLENLQHNYEGSGTFDIGKDGLTIKEETSDGNSASNGPFGDTVNYNPGRDYSVDDRPPIVGLYHELAHVYDYANGTKIGGEYDGDDTADHGIDNDERQATGLPVDHDDDDSTPEIIDPDHPFDYTENGLRDELGHRPREHYDP